MKNAALLASVLGALALVSSAARADVAPPDSCSAGQVGQACTNAMSDDAGSTSGVCTQTTCEHPTPDGSTSYTCYRCLHGSSGSDAGTAGAGGGAGAAGAEGSSSSPPPSGGDSGGGGCAIRGLSRDGALASLMLAVGLGALAIQRRRRA
jgi:hypothetical protein